MFLKHEQVSEYLEGLVNYKLLSPIPRVFDSLSLEWGSGICISNKSPGDAVAARLETTSRESLSKNNLEHIKYPVFSEAMTQQTKNTEKNGILTSLRQVSAFPSLVQATS